MGQKSSTIDGHDYNSLIQNYKVKNKISSSNFGEATLVENKNSKDEYILKEITVTNQADFQRNLKLYESKSNLKNPNVIQLIGKNNYIRKLSK